MMSLRRKTLKAKVCLVGEKGVGKTSLIDRFVRNTFAEEYIATIGTRVSKKELHLYWADAAMQVDVDMLVWDIMGEKGFRELLKEAYFHGAQGILGVCDATRKDTLMDLDDWIDSVLKVVGRVPVLMAINKSDLDGKAFKERDIEQIAKAFDCPYVFTSAKTGENVEKAFHFLGETIGRAELADSNFK